MFLSDTPKLLFELSFGEDQSRWAAVWAMVRMGELGSLRKKSFNLFRLQFVARFYSGLACNRCQSQIQKRFGIRLSLGVLKSIDQDARQFAGF